MDSQKIQGLLMLTYKESERNIPVEALAEQVTGEEGAKKKLRFKSPAKKRTKRPENIVINTPSENPKTTNVLSSYQLRSGRQINKDVGGSKKRISSASKSKGKGRIGESAGHGKVTATGKSKTKGKGKSKGVDQVTVTQNSKGKAPVVESSETESLNNESDCLSWHSEELRSIASSDNDECDQSYNPQFDEEAEFGNVTLELGMEFTTLDVFKQAVKDFNIDLGRNFTWVKNDNKRARARCTGEDCTWEIFCSYNPRNHCFQVKTFRDQHTCARSFRNKQAQTPWVVNKLVKKLRKSPNLKARDVSEHFKTKYGVELDKSKIYRSTLQARAIVEGSEHEQFAKLWDYCHELERANPGSSITLDTVSQTDCNPIFHRLYVCIAGCKEGFKAGCRPMIGLDGAFLKGYYGGHLLSAVGQDANNHIWPIAYAVVDSENKEN